ncbi:hypothetical protein C8R48DRAFT_224987 [Suillus tomentosus]|nr:hypothetical protein C8R48DRAFT_224987 [Suillus tomentosus]
MVCMEIFREKPVTQREMTQFHSDEHVEFLSRITPSNMNSYITEQHEYNIGDDYPVFDGLFDYCSISAERSMGNSVSRGIISQRSCVLQRVLHVLVETCDIAVNWAGGLHHAKKSEASSFCYVNDIVLNILESFRYHTRVLYIDIDVHHGDGAEEAFADRVMTVSFHNMASIFQELANCGT